MATIRKRDNSWQVQIFCKGNRKSATFSTKAEASAWAAETEDRIARLHALKTQSEYHHPADMVSEHDIVLNSTHSDSMRGVYFLILDERVVYIGQSVDVHCRISEHKRRGRKFSRFFILSVPHESLDEIEAKYIVLLRPEGNIGRKNKLIFPSSTA